MLKVSWSRQVAALIYCCTIWLCGSSEALQHVDGGNTGSGMGNSIAAPGQPLYYLMADVGSTVGPNDELKRTNRHLMKWWEDLFGQNNCCNNNNNLLNYNNNNNILPNNCNGFQLQNLDPFKQMKLFKKLPDLWGNNCGGQCGGQCGGLQPVNNYAAPVGPNYGSGDGYAPPPQPAPAVPAAPVDYNPAPAPPSGGYETPNPTYDGPGDGDAGYVAPAPPPPPPAAESYEAPPTDNYAAPPAASYEAPAPAPPTYEPAAPAPAPESYSKVDDYGNANKGYGGAQPPQIVYQPIIYLTTSPGAKGEMDIRPKPQEQSYEAPKEQPQPLPAYEPPPTMPAPAPAPVYAPPPAPAAAPAPPCNTPACAGYLPLVGVPFYSFPAPPAPPPAPVYAAPAPPPAPVYAPPPVAPPAPSYASPACQSPIRLSLYDQPYRVAPELFQEYNYRLSLAESL
ncbi:hypothetical protein ACLKA7_004171 [Drosophila subpalustris]